MGKNKKNMGHTRKEEEQGKKILIGIGVVAVVLVIAMFVLYSFWG